jgi:chemotaxis response regulator CheB
MHRQRHKLLIVDDNPFFSACLMSLINAEPDMVVCGDATSGATLDSTLAVCSPDVILMDLGLGPESGLGIARKLRQDDVTTPFIFISSLGTPPAATLRKIGRCAFLKKGDVDSGILRLIRKVISEFVSPRPTARISGGKAATGRGTTSCPTQ